MASDPLLDFVIPSRDQIAARWLRDYKIRNPAGDISPNTGPWLDAQVFADQMTGLYALGVRGATRGLIRRSYGVFLDEIGDTLDTKRPLARGASGFIRVTTSVGGAQLFAGDEVRSKTTSKRYIVTRSGLYDSTSETGQDLVPVSGVDTGTETNLDPGEVMTFTSGRPGLAPVALVALSAGAGLTGGGPREEDQDYQERLVRARQARPASGNEDDYLDEIVKTEGVGVEHAFVYPAVLGPGTVGVAFTVAAAPGGSRRPSAAQIDLVEAHLANVMPSDDMIFVAAVAKDTLFLAFQITWNDRVLPWSDAAPWPPYAKDLSSEGSTAPGPVVALVGGTPTLFTLRTTNDIYTGTVAPVAGQTIAFFVPEEGRFARKRIGTVTRLGSAGAGPWRITVDQTNAASDVRYAPKSGQRAMPYAPGLDALAGPVVEFARTLGPGEMITSPHAPLLRQTRVPAPPGASPISIDNRLLGSLLAAPGVRSVLPLEGLDHAQPEPTPGAVVWLTELDDLAFFP